MTDHASNVRRILRVAVVATLAASLLVGCSGDDDGDSDALITTAVRILVSASVPVRGVQVDLRHGSQVSVVDVSTGATWAGATCEENVTAGRVQAGCVASSDLATPFTAWTIAMRHSTSVDPLDAITALTCVASSGTGAPIAATCTAE